jgi:hypothetical protein
MKGLKSTLVFLTIALLAISPVQQAYAQPPATATIALSYSIGSSLTLTASPTSTNLLNNGVYGNPVTLTSTWNLAAGGGTGTGGSYTVELDAYFSSATAALTGPANVPSSKVYDQVATSIAGNTAGAASGACNMTVAADAGAPAGASCPTLFKVPGTTGSGTDSSTTIAFSIDNSITLAGNYTGTVNLILQAF